MTSPFTTNMKFEIQEETNIVVKLDSVSFKFRPFAPKDAFIAAAILTEFNYSESKIPSIDLNQLTDHVMEALESIEGVLKLNDEQLTADKIKELYKAKKIKFLFLVKTFITPWASEVLKAGGFLDKLITQSESETEE